MDRAARPGQRPGADAALGRLSFSVDLGPAHLIEEGTAEEHALAANPTYFVTRQVRFLRCDRDRAAD